MGAGNQRSYMHAYDCARLMNIIMENIKGDTIVNIGTKETISVSDLVYKICKISGKNPKIIFDTSKPEGRFVKSSDTTHLQKIITGNKITTIEIDEGLKKMIFWYKEILNKCFQRFSFDKGGRKEESNLSKETKLQKIFARN